MRSDGRMWRRRRVEESVLLDAVSCVVSGRELGELRRRMRSGLPPGEAAPPAAAERDGDDEAPAPRP